MWLSAVQYVGWCLRSFVHHWGCWGSRARRRLRLLLQAQPPKLRCVVIAFAFTRPTGSRRSKGGRSGLHRSGWGRSDCRRFSRIYVDLLGLDEPVSTSTPSQPFNFNRWGCWGSRAETSNDTEVEGDASSAPAEPESAPIESAANPSAPSGRRLCFQGGIQLGIPFTQARLLPC